MVIYSKVKVTQKLNMTWHKFSQEVTKVVYFSSICTPELLTALHSEKTCFSRLMLMVFQEGDVLQRSLLQPAAGRWFHWLTMCASLGMRESSYAFLCVIYPKLQTLSQSILWLIYVRANRWWHFPAWSQRFGPGPSSAVASQAAQSSEL